MNTRPLRGDKELLFDALIQLSEILSEIGISELIIREDEQEVEWDEQRDGLINRAALTDFCTLIEAHHARRRAENTDFGC
jgi:hypothetical protein